MGIKFTCPGLCNDQTETSSERDPWKDYYEQLLRKEKTTKKSYERNEISLHNDNHSSVCHSEFLILYGEVMKKLNDEMKHQKNYKLKRSDIVKALNETNVENYLSGCFVFDSKHHKANQSYTSKSIEETIVNIDCLSSFHKDNVYAVTDDKTDTAGLNLVNTDDSNNNQSQKRKFIIDDTEIYRKNSIHCGYKCN